LIRRTATERRVPCFTSLDTLRAALDGSSSSRSMTVRTVDEYRGGGSRPSVTSAIATA
jgi:carbamoyl-phosphate synthase large subunit